MFFLAKSEINCQQSDEMKKRILSFREAKKHGKVMDMSLETSNGLRDFMALVSRCGLSWDDSDKVITLWDLIQGHSKAVSCLFVALRLCPPHLKNKNRVSLRVPSPEVKSRAH